MAFVGNGEETLKNRCVEVNSQRFSMVFRSSLLSAELEREREKREAMEREVQQLRAQLEAQQEPSTLPAAGSGACSPNRNCWGSQFILQRVDGQDDLGT